MHSKKEFSYFQNDVSENLDNSVNSLSNSESESEEEIEELNDYIEDLDDQSLNKASCYIQRKDGTFQHKANAINSFLNTSIDR